MKQPEDCESIEDVRRAIDALDREVISLIDRRARYVEAAASFKTGERSVRAPERQQAMLADRRLWAEEAGLDPDVIEEIYRTLVSYFVDREMQHWRDVT
ncbi:MAG TPA: isochorismate lyase [Rubrobacter sp.]|nr:isochorismate lyase [Rubrobacter sp.]